MKLRALPASFSGEREANWGKEESLEKQRSGKRVPLQRDRAVWWTWGFEEMGLKEKRKKMKKKGEMVEMVEMEVGFEEI